MTYEELRQATVRYLTGRGMRQEGNSFLKELQQQHQIVINGQPSVQVSTTKVKIEILGEGSIDDQPTIGLKIMVNNQDQGDYWTSNTKDLQDIHI